MGAGCMKPMCSLLTVVDPKIVVVALEFLDNVLAYGKNVKIYYYY